MLMFRFGFEFISTKKSKQNQNLVLRSQNGELKNQNLVLKNQNPTLLKSLSFDWSSSLFCISHAATPLGSFSALAMAAASLWTLMSKNV